VTLKQPHETYVHTDDDLFRLWQDMMGPGGFGHRSLWLIFIYADGQLSPVVAPIDDIPAAPDPVALGVLAHVIADILTDEPGTVAFLLSRPGTGQMLAGDRRWARAIREAVDPTVAPWPVHLATYERLQVFAPDDLIAA
jgi:hypothetical protein